MSNYLSEEIRKCRRRAEDCAQKAATQTDQILKQYFLKLEESWLVLARSYAHHERQISEEAKPAVSAANMSIPDQAVLKGLRPPNLDGLDSI